MAGLGFKDFQVGEVLTSSDVDGYLMSQAVMRFADSTARGSALGTAPGTAVALAEGMASYLDDVNRIEVFDGTVWKPTGAVLQVASVTKVDQFTTTSSTPTPITGLSVSITPSSSSSKVLVMLTLTMDNASSSDNSFQLKRDSTSIATSTGASVNGTFTNNVSVAFANQELPAAFAVNVLDTPATTSSVTYSVDCSTGAGTLSVNRTTSGTSYGATSSLTVFEVA